MKKLCYLGGRLNVSGGNEAAVTARTRIKCIKFRLRGVVSWKKAFAENERKNLPKFYTVG